MHGGVVQKLREPRYAALGVLMLVVAIGCVACGIWQIYRYESKHDENARLRANADRPVADVARVLPVVGTARAPGRDDVEFRTVRATGRYDASAQTLVRNRTDGDDTGFLVVTPLRTADGTLLVVRGFAPQPASGALPRLAPPPSGPVTVTGRTQAPETRDDRARDLTDGQVLSINPAQQAGRLGTRVFDGYAELEDGAPGTAGLRTLGRPDLSNPAGGALEPQHFAYVIQWFVFALLAVAAPFAMIRAENRRRDRGEFDDTSAAPAEPRVRPDDGARPDPPDDERARKLADRYGRPVR